MSRFSRDRYRLDIDGQTLVLSSRRPRDAAWRPVAAGEHPGIPALEGFASALADFRQTHLPRGARWTAVIADELARFFILSAPDGIGRLRDLQQVAALRCASLFGDAADDWICAGDWRAQGPFLVCALPTPLVRSLTTSATPQRTRLEGITPRFVETWNQHPPRMRQPLAWVMHASARYVVLAATAGQTPVAVSQSASPAWETLDALRTMLRRASLQWGLALPNTLYAEGESMRRWHGHSIDSCRILHLSMPGETPA
ncbi:hypothetical protein [Cupriavidus pauculus]|uniref:hypothetical protein n=1 Tax=Cupriavidus pauculus TaxID=82633 RepID=UPI001EE1DFFE|nr:hypothetical protein [Cupriavidus pauculus]GJG96672.1 hypothetical protein CBA19C6_19305 [Cupriavidus pauculus]